MVRLADVRYGLQVTSFSMVVTRNVRSRRLLWRYFDSSLATDCH